MARLGILSQPTLRPFDVAVVLRLLLEPEDRYEPLAEALATSTSAVHRGVARLQGAGLLQPASRTVVRPALRDFLLFGVRYAFPAVRGAEVSGVATAWSIGAIATLFTVDDAADLPAAAVWPDAAGQTRGDLLVPLFPGAVRAAARDARLHLLLAAVDALRAGPSTVQRVVTASLIDRMLCAQHEGNG
jgi:hypothetical protein